MAMLETDGEQTCVIGTDHTLVSAEADDKTFICHWDLVNAVNGDVFQLTVLEKVRSTSTVAIIYQGFYAHDQGGIDVIASPAVVSLHEIQMKVKQVAGTGRVVPFALLSV